jgi:hypothetical protein
LSNKVIHINDTAYIILHVLGSHKSKEEADVAVRRYSRQTPAILIQSKSGEWIIAQKVKDAIFTDISDLAQIEDNTSTPQLSGENDGSNNKAEN